jgi:hypothetical protein
LSAQDARALKRVAILANAREAKARSQLGEEREVSTELREALEEKEAFLDALRVDVAERAKLERSARDLKQQRQAWRSKNQAALWRETGVEDTVNDLETALSDSDAK